MIKLTLKHSANDSVYVNASQIVCFYADSEGSEIEVTNGDNICVKETPEEIQKLIEKVI